MSSQNIPTFPVVVAKSLLVRTHQVLFAVFARVPRHALARVPVVSLRVTVPSILAGIVDVTHVVVLAPVAIVTGSAHTLGCIMA